MKHFYKWYCFCSLHIYRVWLTCMYCHLSPWNVHLGACSTLLPLSAAVFCNSDSYTFACSFQCVWLAFGVWLHRGFGDLWTFWNIAVAFFRVRAFIDSAVGCMYQGYQSNCYTPTHTLCYQTYMRPPQWLSSPWKWQLQDCLHSCSWINHKADQILGVLWRF